MAQLGRALRSGQRSRGFKSRQPDHSKTLNKGPLTTPMIFPKSSRITHTHHLMYRVVKREFPSVHFCHNARPPSTHCFRSVNPLAIRRLIRQTAGKSRRFLVCSPVKSFTWRITSGFKRRNVWGRSLRRLRVAKIYFPPGLLIAEAISSSASISLGAACGSK